MGFGTFFIHWPTWAQLGFVLGSLFVVVITLAGLVKAQKFFSHRKQQTVQPADLEAAEIRERVRSSDEIPFGAKAMLEEPDIEGVWNSRASTPLQSPVLNPRHSSPSRLSLNLFSRSRRNSSISSVPSISSQFSLPGGPTAHSTPGTEPSPLRTSSNSGRTFKSQPSDRRSHETKWTIGNPVPSETPEHMPRRRSVTIGTRAVSESTVDSSITDESISRTTGVDSIRRARVATDPTSDAPNQIRPGRALHLTGPATNTAALERTPTTKKALARMEAHRKFHAAESGQLQPRLKTPETKTSSHKHSSSESVATEHETTRAVSWPITQGEALLDLEAPHKVQTKTSPHVVPFRAFVEMHPPPQTASKAPPSAWTNKTQGLLEEKLEAQTSKKKFIIKNSPANLPPKDMYIVSNGSVSKDEHERVSLLGTQTRHINDDFEVFPAGSLEQTTPIKDFGLSREPLREASNEAKPKKLQKRNRSISRERRSSLETVRHILA